MTDISGFGAKDDVSFARELVERYGVAGVPGSSFYFDHKSVRHKFDSCFCKNYETLTLARTKTGRHSGFLKTAPFGHGSEGIRGVYFLLRSKSSLWPGFRGSIW